MLRVSFEWNEFRTILNETKASIIDKRIRGGRGD